MDDAAQRLTWGWLRKFANQYKQASYQDKLNALYNENNPFYLLEWVVLPIPSFMLEEINFPRSPGMWKNSYLKFSEVFFQQILLELCYNIRFTGNFLDSKMQTAICDLRDVHGHEVWDEAINAHIVQLEKTIEKHGEFVQQLELEQLRIQQAYEQQLAAIEQSAETDEMEKEEKRQSFHDSYMDKKEQAPRKLLHKQYSAWPLLSYFHHHARNRPEELTQRLQQRLTAGQKHNYNYYIAGHDYTPLCHDLNHGSLELKPFVQWFVACASKTEMNRGFIQTEHRQNWWNGLLQYIFVSAPFAESEVLVLATFEIEGFVEVMMGRKQLPGYLHLLVMAALSHHHDPVLRKWLSDIVILRNWDLFLESFSMPEYSFQALSWVLCLDPIQLQQRLLRKESTQRGQMANHIQLDAMFVVERCCELFADGIRAGLPAQVIIPFFHYLAIHDQDALYTYLHRVKHRSELLPILGMEPTHAQRIFSGNTIQATSARKHLHRHFLEGMQADLVNAKEISYVRELGKLLLADKSVLLIQWLESLHPHEEDWPVKQARLLAEIMHIEWLGNRGASHEEQHKLIEQWLHIHSDWIQFELDTQQLNRTVQYRIIRPGFRDQLTDKVLARVIVRTEWNDPEEISNLLDDLRSL